MNENFILPSMGWNIAFLLVCALWVLLLSASREGIGDWKKFFQSQNVQIGVACVAMVLLLANFVWTLKLLHIYSSKYGTENIFAFIFVAVMVGIIVLLTVCSLSRYYLSVGDYLNVSNICVSVVGICFLAVIHFESMLYCIGAICISSLMLLLEYLSVDRS